MPELAGTQLIAIASFASLVVAWLMAPAEAAPPHEPVPAAA